MGYSNRWAVVVKNQHMNLLHHSNKYVVVEKSLHSFTWMWSHNTYKLRLLTWTGTWNMISTRIYARIIHPSRSALIVLRFLFHFVLDFPELLTLEYKVVLGRGLTTWLGLSSRPSWTRSMFLACKKVEKRFVLVTTLMMLWYEEGSTRKIGITNYVSFIVESTSTRASTRFLRLWK